MLFPLPTRGQACSPARRQHRPHRSRRSCYPRWPAAAATATLAPLVARAYRAAGNGCRCSNRDACLRLLSRPSLAGSQVACEPVTTFEVSPRQLNGATARGEEQQRPASRQTKAEEAEAAWLKASFRPFPSLLRWPTAPCFACICCMSGLLQGAATILVAHKTAPRHAVAAAAVGAAIVLGVLLLLWTQLDVFARHHAHLMWVPQRAPITPSGVEDPALRLVSTLRQRVLRHSSQQQVSSGVSRWSTVLIEQSPTLDRKKGSFAAHGHRKHESAEPERTERLLANPLALFPPTASDAYESVAVTVLYKSRGDRKHAIAYHLGRLSVQVRVIPARQPYTRAPRACTADESRIT